MHQSMNKMQSQQLQKQILTKQQQQQLHGRIAPLILDSSTALKVTTNSAMFQERALMGRNDTWHKIQITRGAKFDKEFILKSILNAVYPADLIPVRYQVHGEDSFFLARNCGTALEKICRTNLIVCDLNGEPLILTVTLGFASIHDIKINIQPLLLTLLTKRHDVNRKILYLDSFHKDTELSRTVYCPLTQLRTFSHVLKLAKTSLPPLDGLSLRDNELSNLSAIETANLNALKFLDLRNNDLLTMDTLAPLKNVPVTDLWLDDNPLCENYSNPERYIEAAKKFCPTLQKLDGVLVHSDLPNMPLLYKSYIKNQKRKKLVNQFVEHFFSLYDQKDRRILRGIYHEDATFSLTLGTPPSLAGRQDLLNFLSDNRNLLKLHEYVTWRKLLYQGHDSIINAVLRYPPTQHLRKTFSIDLMYEDRNFLMICIEGLFKNMGSVLAFNRTFVLVPGDDSEFNIINDQLHIFFLPQGIGMANSSKFEDFEIAPMVQLTCLSEKEKEELVDMFCEVSTMNEKYCHKHLEDVGWDVRRAIKDFMFLYKSGCVPPEAFLK